MTNNQLTDERLVKILSETQATIMEHNSRCVRGSVEVDARLFESMIMELQERRKAAMDSEPVAEVLSSRPGNDTSTIDRALPVGTTLYRHAQPVVPPMQHWEELCREYPDMSIRDAIIRAAWWNHCRAAMLQAGNSPVIPDGLIAAVNRLLDSDGSRGCYSAIQCGDAHDEIERLLAAAPHDTPALNSVQSVVTVPGKWIPVSERVPENDGAYLCWDKRYVTTYAFIFGAWQANQFIAKNITHWMPLPAAPQEVNHG